MGNLNTNEPQVIIKEVIVYKSYTPAQQRASKKWYSNPDNKAKVNAYYRNRFHEGSDEYKEKVRQQGRERARRAYYAKKCKELKVDCMPHDGF